MKIFRDKDADLSLLSDKSLTVVGYGNQGEAFAKNLRDSGMNVSIALRQSSRSVARAAEDGFPVIANEDVYHADIIFMMLPDHLHGEYFAQHLAGRLKRGQALVFAHGYSIHFGLIVPLKGIHCALVAPHGPGKDLRESFEHGSGISCFVASHPNNSRVGLRLAVSVASAIGCARVGAFKTTFAHEALGDLFGEQALLCGGLTHLTIAVFETLVANGIPEESAYLETAHQLELLAGLIRRYGISGMIDKISCTAQFGTVVSEPVFSDSKIRRDLVKLYKDIESGRFARRWREEYEAGYKSVNEFRRKLKSSTFEKTSRRVRRLLDDSDK